jgi:hypothetical protein
MVSYLGKSWIEISGIVIRCEDCKLKNIVYTVLQTNTIIVDFFLGLEAPRVGDVASNWINNYPVLFTSFYLV